MQRFVTYGDLAFERRCRAGSTAHVLGVIALYEQDPRPLTEFDSIRLDGLQEIVRAHLSRGADLKRAHRRPRGALRGRSGASESCRRGKR